MTQAPDACAAQDEGVGKSGPLRSAILWILVCAGISVVWGSWLETTNRAGMADFKAVYYGARCLIHHRDPYNPAEFERVYLAEGGTIPPDTPARMLMFRHAIFACINLPTAMLLLLPFAVLPWKLAYLLWMALIAASLTLAVFLMCLTARRQAPALSLFLACVAIANVEVLFALGNLAGVAISLCLIAAWCFLEERFIPAGVLCMAAALALKPHDAGLVWLYFLLAGGAQRKRALQALALVAALAVPSVLWVQHVAPQWAAELHANVLAGAAHGGLNDPGPASPSYSYADMEISLQAAISVFLDNPLVYNAASYLVCGALLLAWAIGTLRTCFTRANGWLALASVSALSLLPVYHRLHDAKLLLLAIPACAMLWAEGSRVKWPAALLTSATIVVTADIPSTLLLIIATSVRGHVSGIWETIAMLTLMRPAGPLLLATGVFYLCVYLRRASTANS